MATRGEIDAALDTLSWQQRLAVTDAVGGGRAVEDEQLARLAADHAEVTHRQLMRFFVGLVAVSVLAFCGLLAVLPDLRNDLSIAGVLVAGALTLTLFGLLVWAIALRPLVRAQQANLHLAGAAEEGPARRDGSNWVLAWFIAWPIAGLVGAGLRATGFAFAGPLTLAAWVAVIWFSKRALDDR